MSRSDEPYDGDEVMLAAMQRAVTEKVLYTRWCTWCLDGDGAHIDATHRVMWMNGFRHMHRLCDAHTIQAHTDYRGYIRSQPL